jgi:DNA-binding transcriptional MerR regulator
VPRSASARYYERLGLLPPPERTADGHAGVFADQVVARGCGITRSG